MEHSVASLSLMAGIFACFPTFTTFFSSYRFDGHIWHTTCASTHRVIPESGPKSYVPILCFELEAFKYGTQHRVAKSYDLNASSLKQKMGT